MVEYTNPALITDVRITPVPHKGRTISGFGGAIPTRYMVRYMGRWYRVRMMQYGNAGSAYIRVHGWDLFLDTDTEHRLQGMSND